MQIKAYRGRGASQMIQETTQLAQGLHQPVERLDRRTFLRRSIAVRSLPIEKPGQNALDP